MRKNRNDIAWRVDNDSTATATATATTPSSLLGRMLNDNFILRRRGISLKNFQPQSLRNSEMCQQLSVRPRPTQTPSPTPIEELPDLEESTKPNHKVVIYFGDSINRQQPSPKDLHSQLLQEMSQKLKVQDPGDPVKATLNLAGEQVGNDHQLLVVAAADELPPYIESVQNGVINIKIEGNYRRASALVETVAKPTLAVVSPTKFDSAQAAADTDLTKVEEDCSQV
ncbi:uncharacterized protein Dwil_GK27830 [Drosophila willistoni]|uniref:Uncharacterized protein n=1 Tax=Drosophila willistoni TaxID=7260 RepID=A0A0Q9X119_DROWI|nr:uncharacterized protein Dwil_GK27830 [Drosophila willistoni]